MSESDLESGTLRSEIESDFEIESSVEEQVLGGIRIT